MNDSFNNYIDALGLTEAVRRRVAKILRFYSLVVGDTIEDIFVSEYVLEDSGRIHESLVLFSDRFVMEGSLTEDETLDFLPCRGAIRYWVVKRKDYDFEYATESSRMTVEIWFDGERYLQLKASGSNCDALKAVCLKRVLPNTWPPASSLDEPSGQPSATSRD